MQGIGSTEVDVGGKEGGRGDVPRARNSLKGEDVKEGEVLREGGREGGMELEGGEGFEAVSILD